MSKKTATMTARAEEIAADGPYRADWENGFSVVRDLNAPEGNKIMMMMPDNMEWFADRMNEARANGYKQGQQDRWIPLEEALKSRGLQCLPEGSLVAWRRKRKPHHSYEHGIYRENEDKARDQFSLKGCDVIILELPPNPEQR